MVLVYNKVFIVKSSSDILFFKIIVEDETELRLWKQYDKILERGNIYYIKGNVRIQVTTD